MNDPTHPHPRPDSPAVYRLLPGPRPATYNDLRLAQERDRLLRTELPRVQQAATAWRNGLGALLGALIGFGLIKGRSDVSQLDPHWAAWVGVLLVVAILTGALGALLLIRAAHGRPAVTSVREIHSTRAADHVEALACAAALRWGIAATLGCALLLVTAVGLTWYGPERARPSLQVHTPSGVICGTTIRLNPGGVLVLKTFAGEVTVDLTTATAVNAVDRCP